MNFNKKLIVFTIIFTIIFYCFRILEIVPEQVLKESLDGVAWLYSSIGLIFGMVSGFIIQSQWNKWDNLVNAIRGEINSLRELLEICESLSKKDSSKIKLAIKKYLHCLINKEGWQQVDKGEISMELEKQVAIMQNHIFNASDDLPKYSKEMIKIFGKIKTFRNNRLRYSSEHLPFILNILITFSTFLIIILSLLIYVHNPFMDYIFTYGLSLLVFLVLTIIKDLDHPYKPGNWHLNKENYRKLLEEIK